MRIAIVFIEFFSKKQSNLLQKSNVK